jgi:hypothetical protein
MCGQNLDVTSYVEMMEKQMALERDQQRSRAGFSDSLNSVDVPGDEEEDELDGLCKRFSESGCETIEQYLRNCNGHVLGAASEPASFGYYFDVNSLYAAACE